MIPVIKGVMEKPCKDRTGEKICDYMIGRFVNVLDLQMAGIDVDAMNREEAKK
jgi:hypothetical protein